MKLLSLALIIAAFALSLAAIWWWALFGMSADVGSAWMFTVFMLACAGAGILSYPSGAA